MQIIFLTGNLTRDAVIRTSNENGVTAEFISFNMACNEQTKTGRITTYYEVTCSKSGVFPFLKKGQYVSVFGNFRQTTSRSQDGKEYLHNSVSAWKVELPPKKGDSPTQPGEW